MTNPQQTPHRQTEITSRRQQVAEMYLRGMYQSAIGEALGVDQATVSRDLTELRKEWLERSINHIDQKKAIELAKLDRLEVTYWEAWERSQQNAEIETTEQIGERKKIKVKGADGKDEQQESIVPERIKKSKRVEGQSGNPAFLDGVLKCISKRCEILGLNAPIKQELGGPKGGPIPIQGVNYRTVAAVLAPGSIPDSDAPGEGENPIDGPSVG